jgi:hypothetical protein
VRCGRNATTFLKSSVDGRDTALCGVSAISQSFVVAIVPGVTRRTTAMMSHVLNEGRLFGLGPVDWSLLLGSFVLCGLLTAFLS